MLKNFLQHVSSIFCYSLCSSARYPWHKFISEEDEFFGSMRIKAHLIQQNFKKYVLCITQSGYPYQRSQGSIIQPKITTLLVSLSYTSEPKVWLVICLVIVTRELTLVWSHLFTAVLNWTVIRSWLIVYKWLHFIFPLQRSMKCLWGIKSVW